LCPGSGVQRAILLFGEFSPRLAVLDGEITETGIATAEKLSKNELCARKKTTKIIAFFPLTRKWNSGILLATVEENCT